MIRIGMRRLALAIVTVVCLPAGVPTAHALAPDVASPASSSPYIVEFTFGTDPDVGAAHLLGLGADVFDVYRSVFAGAAIRAAPSVVDILRGDPLIAHIEADQVFTLDSNETLAQAPIVQFGPSWGLDRIDQRFLPLSNSYSYTDSGQGVTAYIVDSGIYLQHNEFGGRARLGFANAIDTSGVGDCNGHGTHVAGTVGGATYGVAKHVSLVAVRVLDCNGSAPFSRILDALDWVIVDHQAGSPAVVNMSIGGHASSPGDAALINDAVQSTVNDGITVVIAAGNAPQNGPPEDSCTVSPAQAPAAITVAASAENDSRASFSDFGTCVDLFAPGVDIKSAYSVPPSPTMTAVLSGTSMAAPHVTGAVAVLLSRRPTWTPAQVARDLLASATPNVISDPMGSPNKLLFSPPSNPPSNDQFAAATAFDVATTTSLSGTNVDATVEPGEPAHGPVSGGASAWWKFVAPEFGTVTMSTAGSTFDTMLAIYAGSSIGALSRLATDDGPGNASNVSVHVQRGQTYYVAVDGAAGLQGSISLHVTWTPAEFVPLVPGRLLETLGAGCSDGGRVVRGGGCSWGWFGDGVGGGGSWWGGGGCVGGGVDGDGDRAGGCRVCDGVSVWFAQPLTSNVNFVAGSTVANSVVSGVGAGGRVCLFTMVATHLVVDVDGFFPAGSSFVSLVPGRLLESRSGNGAATVDGLFGGVGVRAAGSVTELSVAGRGGVAADASAVVLTVTVTQPVAAGFVTVFPCGSPQPLTSNVNFVAGATVADSVVSGVGAGGRVCLFTMVDTHLVVDVDGYFPAGSSFVSLVPGRLLETRSGPGAATVDGLFGGVGVRAAGSVTELTVAGRGGVGGADASAVVLTVTVTQPVAAGFVTVFPCGSPQPLTSNVNFVAGATVANSVVSGVGAGGRVCLFTMVDTHLVVDVDGYVP